MPALHSGIFLSWHVQFQLGETRQDKKALLCKARMYPETGVIYIVEQN